MATTPKQPLSIPPLENGDHLSRSEFERRYAAAMHIKKVELIEGVVYVAAALRFRSHGKPHAQLMGWLFNYQVATPGTELGDNSTVRLDLDNEPQPDIALFLDPAVGGQVQISADDYIEGAPELIAEIAASSAAYDLGDKKKAYRRNGVREYIVWQMFENKLDWFVLENDDYVNLAPDATGIIRSRVFPGLWLQVPALLSGDMKMVLLVLQTGLGSPDILHLTLDTREAEPPILVPRLSLGTRVLRLCLDSIVVQDLSSPEHQEFVQQLAEDVRQK